MTQEMLDVYAGLFDAMHQAYRALSADPASSARANVIRDHTFQMGQSIADAWGFAGLTRIIGEMEERGDMLAVSFLDHKWSGVKFPEGGTWCA